MDWKAVMSSEVFREYVNIELKKEASQAIKEDVDKDKIFDEFKIFEKKINTDSRLKQVFSALKVKIAKDPDYRAKVHPDFVNGIMMLFIDDEDQKD